MTARTILENQNPITQTCDAVKNLLAFVGRASDPMPSDVALDNGRLVLVLSNDRKCYYVVTARACSCPSAIYRHNGPCKHQRKYFPQPATTKPVSDNEPLVQRGGFKPFSLTPREERALKEVA